MDVYMYQGAFLCEDCVGTVEEGCAEDTGDSDDYPQGPYSDGGGEADCPNHCDDCGCFLENPLTKEGRAYVQARVDSLYGSKTFSGNRDLVSEWGHFYDIKWSDKVEDNYDELNDAANNHVDIDDSLRW